MRVQKLVSARRRVAWLSSIVLIAVGCGWLSRGSSGREAGESAARDTLRGRLILVDSGTKDMVFAVQKPARDTLDAGLVQYLTPVPGDTATKELWVITGWASDSFPTRVRAQLVNGSMRLTRVNDASSLWNLRADEEVQILFRGSGLGIERTPAFVEITPKVDALERQRPDSFPWPPPPPTSRFEVPAGLVVQQRPEQLGAIFSRVREALLRANLQDYAVYPIGGNGFAVVARIERISDDGKHLSGIDRWAWELKLGRSGGWDPGEYVRALVSGRRGRYRVIVLAVTARPMITDPDSAAPISGADRIRHLVRRGDVSLSYPLARAVAAPGTRCVALIYELERPGEDAKPRLLNESPVAPVTHLSDAGLWPSDQLKRR
jgi:hypothetical protein